MLYLQLNTIFNTIVHVNFLLNQCADVSMDIAYCHYLFKSYLDLFVFNIKSVVS